MANTIDALGGPNDPSDRSEPSQSSLGTAAAHNLATTTKSAPQMQGITSRWLLKMLPWVETRGGAFRVNRRLSYSVGDGRVTFISTGSRVQVVPQELRELPPLRGFENDEVLGLLASRFVQQEYQVGDVIVESGKPAEHVFLLAHGKANKLGPGKYGAQSVIGVLADGDYFGERTVVASDASWEITVKALTPCTVLALPRRVFAELLERSEVLRAHLEQFKLRLGQRQDKFGQAAIDVSAGHAGEPVLPGTFVDYELAPREYDLHVAQTVLRLHSRVSDLYNEPMNQLDQQLRLTVEELRERQEHELINNRDIGLLYNADLSQRLHTRSGPPTPDDMDDLLSRRRKTRFFLAHPRAIAAFGRECNKRKIYPFNIDLDGRSVRAWRGVPILPCNKIPIHENGTTSILAMRTGEKDQGVIGLHQTGLPDEYQPGLNVRRMSHDPKGVQSYLVSAYYSAAVLIPDALGILENVEIGR